MSVKIKAFQDGTIIRDSKKEGRSIVMLAQESYNNIGGALVKASRRAIFNLPTELAHELKLSDGCDFNAKLKGFGLKAVEIIRKESTTPFYDGQEAKINPTTDEVVKTSAGEPIYMDDNAYDVGTEVDELVKSAGQEAGAQAEASHEEAEDGNLAEQA
jgi:hypothetical protein